jgi:putative DNA primase/helicase
MSASVPSEQRGSIEDVRSWIVSRLPPLVHPRHGRPTTFYPYVDEHWTLLFVVLRFEPKAFAQARLSADGTAWTWRLESVRRVPYGLPWLNRWLADSDDQRTLALVEGEKDVEAIIAAGGIATCGAGGAGKWRDDYADALAGAYPEVAIVADQDRVAKAGAPPRGLAHAVQVRDSLARVGVSATIVRPPVGKDAADALGAGCSLDELYADRELLVDVFYPQPAATDSANGQPKERHQSLLLSAIAAQRIKWLMPGLVPLRALTLLGGAGGLGKSTFAMRLAADLSRGRLLEDGEPGTTLIVSAEDTAAEILRPRAQAADADLERIRHYHVPLEQGGMLVLPGDFAEFERVITDVAPRLVVIDPIVASLDLQVDSHRDQDVRSVLGQLARLADEHELAVLSVVHLNKTPSRDAYFRIGGSTAFYNACRSVLLVTPDPDNPESTDADASAEPVFRIVSQHKANYSRRFPPRRYEIRPVVLADQLDDRGRPLESSAMVFVEDAGELVLADLLAEISANGEQPKATRALQLLADLLADGGWHDSAGLKTLIGAHGISEPTIKRAAQELAVESKRSGFPASTWWRLAAQSAHPLSHPDEPTGPTDANPHKQAVLGDPDDALGPSRLTPAGHKPTEPIEPTATDQQTTDPARDGREENDV